MSESKAYIRYLRREEIDTGKWDYLISNVRNGLIYSRSFYLDTMAANWSALILNDYEAVMPLTWNSKYGIAYLYQPPFVAQLGLFGTGAQDRGMTESFISESKKHFRFCEINMNFSNAINEGIPRANYILDLNKPYQEIQTGYQKRLSENLEEAAANNLSCLQSPDFETAVTLFENEYGKRFPHVKKRHYQRFRVLCNEMQQRGMIIVKEIRDEQGSLLTASIFFKDTRRIYNIMSVTLQKGREKRSHFLLLDQLIREFADKDLTLDFEGSEVPGIAEFYRKFGSVNQPYSFLKFNHLPFPIRFFK
jgi:hypothetical protein